MREQMLSLILAVRERSYYCKWSECVMYGVCHFSDALSLASQAQLWASKIIRRDLE